MMISAKDAAEITAKSNSAIEQNLRRYDQKVRVAAEEGKDSVDLEVGDATILPLMLKRMKEEFGYKVEQLHSQGFRITWGIR